jgi:hypothetical protein
MQDTCLTPRSLTPRRTVLALAAVIVAATLFAPRALGSANAIPGRVSCDQYLPLVYFTPPGVGPRQDGGYWQAAYWKLTWHELQADGSWRNDERELLHSLWFPKDTTGVVATWFFKNNTPFTNRMFTGALTGTGLIVYSYEYWWLDRATSRWTYEYDVRSIDC